MATLGAATLLAYLGANNLDIIRGGHNQLQNGTSALGDRKVRPTTPVESLDMSKIPGWHLFGKRETKSAAASSSSKRIEAPETRLELSLQGTFLGDKTTEEGWAIISTSDKQQKLYRVGDEIPGGAALYAVEAHQVILTRNNRHESLPLPRPKLDKLANPAKNPKPETSGMPGLPTPNEAGPSM